MYIAAAHKTEHTMNQTKSNAVKPKAELRTEQFNVRVSPLEINLLDSIGKKLELSQADVIITTAKYYATHAFKKQPKKKGDKA